MKIIKEVNSRFYNIEKKFDHFNRLIFNNSLKKDFDFLWSKDKTALGKVKSLVMRKKHSRVPSKIIRVLSLELTDFYDFDEQILDEILIHEMIHVSNDQNNVLEKAHGATFEKKRQSINRKFTQWNIKRTESVGEYSVASNVKVSGNREIHVFLWDDDSFFLMNKFNDEIEDQLIIGFERYTGRNKKKAIIAHARTYNPYFLRYPIGRKLYSAMRTQYILKKDIYRMLKNDIDVYYEFKNGMTKKYNV